MRFVRLLILVVLPVGVLAGCAAPSQPGPAPTWPTAAAASQATQPPAQPPTQAAAKPTLYIPPSAAPGVTLAVVNPTPSPSPTMRLEPLLPSVTPACTSDLKFLEDLTIPDGTAVAPGELLDKRWKVENSGTCNWDQRFTLRLFSGDSLGALEVQALYPARSGAQAVIRILFTAPDQPGSYQSAWKAHDPQGLEFGEAVFMQVVVK